MKKQQLLLLLSVVSICVYNLYSAQKSHDKLNLLSTNIESIAHNESGDGNCKWKIIDCPGWGTGDYEACLINGDGNICSCGSVTRNCPE